MTTLKIVNYSERSIAITGEETKLYKEDFKSMGGKYNANLSCGPGWIFSIKAAPQVQTFLDRIQSLKIASRESNVMTDCSTDCSKKSQDVLKCTLEKELLQCKQLQKELSKKIQDLEERLKQL
jgi:hypothetical protein